MLTTPVRSLEDVEMVEAVAPTPPTTELRRLGGRPPGADINGLPIRDGTDRLIAGAILNLRDVVEQRTLAELPAGRPAAERDARVARRHPAAGSRARAGGA